MAKKEAKAEEKIGTELPEVFVDLATSEEDVLGYDQAGAKLTFLKKRFRSLSRDNLEALSYENRKRYQKVLAEIQEEREASRPKATMQVIDPLGGHEGALLNVKVTDKKWEKQWHLCWKHAVEKDALERVGYSAVRAGEDPVECGLKPAGSTFVLKDPRDRKDLDLILMKISMVTFLQHQTAVAKASHDRVTGYKDKFMADVAESSEGKLKGHIDEEEPEKVELRRQDLTPAE